jgi:hypothetical protein
LLSADFWLIEPLMGWKVNRATLLRDVGGGGGISFRSLTVSGMLVRSYGETVVVTGRVHVKGRLPYSEFDLPCRYTHVYVRRDERWQLVTAQETPIETWGKGSGEARD